MNWKKVMPWLVGFAIGWVINAVGLFDHTATWIVLGAVLTVSTVFLVIIKRRSRMLV